MGLFGTGEAHHLNFARTSCTPRTVKTGCNMKPYCGINLFPARQETVVQYNYGGNSTWAGIGALLGSLDFCGILNSFGIGGGYTSTQAPPTETKYNQLANLKALGPKWTIVQEGDNQFCAVREGYPSITGDYDAVKAHITTSNSTAKEEPQGADNSSSKDNSSSTDKATGNATQTQYNSPGGSTWSAVAANTDFNNVKIRAQDNELGDANKIDKSDISGATEVGEKNSQGYPKTITIAGKTFTFTEVKNGVALYKATGTSGEQIYRLEKNTNGQYALNQWKGDEGANKANWRYNN